MPLLLIALPLAGAVVCFVLKLAEKPARVCLLGVSALETLLAALMLFSPIAGIRHSICPDWIGCDSVSALFLWVTILLFFLVSLHLCAWLPAELHFGEEGETQKLHIFFSCLCAFLGTMVLVMLSRNFGLLWVAVEATTLVSAPLILFHRGRRSLEAMWKYLLICSVGIGLALFGTMLLAVASRATHAELDMAKLLNCRDAIDPAWYRAAFILILAGYGTKMGLAPFHTWLPDAHSEAPGVVSALLSGALLNCSLLGIVRVASVAPGAEVKIVSHLLILLGIVSLVVAAIFIVRQRDFKRMLAYSSVEHMGLLAIFVGAGAFKLGIIHLFGHSLIKMALFLVAGNILLGCGTRQIPLLGGLLKDMPRNARLWIAGILFACGVPPSPLFVTEFALICRLNIALSATVVALLFIIFAGMTYATLKMTAGPSGEATPPSERAAAAEKLWYVPLAALMLCTMIGIFYLYLIAGGAR